MNSKYVGLAFLFLSSYTTWAATFTVINNADHNISISFNGEGPRVIDKGSSHKFNTWFEPVKKFTWTESKVELFDHGTDYRIIHAATYSAHIEVKALSVGGSFIIGKDGAYSYDIPFTGSGKGQATK